MNPDSNPSDLTPHSQNPLHATRTGEQTICEIRRHPIGIFTVYLAIGFMLFVLAMFVFAVMPSLFPESKSQINYYGTLALLFAALLGACVAMVNHVIYWGNRWIVTSDSITQIQQSGLFNKQASQLSLENLEDVSSEKNGILMQMFNYGVLKAETAGEKSKFMFLYCPTPDKYARDILNAREMFMLDVRVKEDARLEEYKKQQAAQSTPPTIP